MYQQIDVTKRRSEPPAILNTLTEVPHALFEIGSLPVMLPGLSLLPRGDGHSVLLVPGFMAGDRSLGILKRYLTFMGYRTETWGVGRNTGKSEHLFEHLPAKLQQMFEQSSQPISLVGQSLGGVFVRELARKYPDRVRQVITLGSPFGAQDGAVTMRAITHLFKFSAGQSIEEMASMVHDRTRSPSVPSTAIYSKCDGVVDWQACCESEEDELTQNIEVAGSHCGMGFNSMIYCILADRLAQNVQQWKKFKS